MDNSAGIGKLCAVSLTRCRFVKSNDQVFLLLKVLCIHCFISLHSLNFSIIPHYLAYTAFEAHLPRWVSKWPTSKKMRGCCLQSSVVVQRQSPLQSLRWAACMEREHGHV